MSPTEETDLYSNQTPLSIETTERSSPAMRDYTKQTSVRRIAEPILFLKARAAHSFAAIYEVR